MSAPISIGPISAAPGTAAFGTLPVATLAGGGELGIGVHVIAGAEPGPGLGLVVGLHGHEYSAIDILRRVKETIDPQRLRGHLVLVPMANPIAFEFASKSGWIDGLHGGYGDLNKTWPGSAGGWITERLAHALATEVLPQLEVVIDFHGEAMNARIRNFYSYVLSTDSDAVSNARLEELAINFGMEVLIERPTVAGPGSLTTYALSQGVYVIGAEISDFWGLELPEGGRSLPGRRTLSETGLIGVLNTMKLLGMIDGEPELPIAQLRLPGMAGVNPPQGGLMIPSFRPEDLGRLFERDTVLARVISPYSFEELGTLTMPYGRGLLVMVRGDPPFVHTQPGGGDFGAYVADADGATWIRR